MIATLGSFLGLGPSAATFTYRDSRAVEIFGGGNLSSAGVNITTDKALSYSPWYRAIDLVSNAVAGNVLAPYRIADDGRSRTVDRDHPLWPLLSSQPNYFQTAFQFVKLMVSHKMSAGNGYAYIIRDGANPVQLVPLDPQATSAVIIRPGGDENSTVPSDRDQVWYVWTPQGRMPVYLRSEDVLHFRGLSAEGLWGYSVVAKAKEALGLGIGQQTYSAKFFGNGAKPGIVLTSTRPLSDATRKTLADAWERGHGGDNQHKTAVLDAGMDLKTVAFSAQDSQLIESRKFSIIDVANFTGVPPHKLGSADRTSYNSLEQENLSFREDTLSAHFTEMEQEATAKLLLESEKAAYDIGFADNAIRVADLKTKAEFASKAVGGPFLTKNEARSVVGYNPIDDPAYDVIPENLNQSTGNDQTNPQQDTQPQDQKPAQGGGASKAMVGIAYKIAIKTMQRLATRAGHQATAAAKDADKFVAFADGFERANKASFLEEFEEAEEAVLHVTGKAPGFAGRMLTAIATQLKQIAERATAKTLPSEVAAACGSLADTLGKEIEGNR